MKVAYDPSVDAMDIRLSDPEGTYDDSDEPIPGIILDYDQQGQLLSVEILFVNEYLSADANPALSDLDLKALTAQLQSDDESDAYQAVIELVHRPAAAVMAKPVKKQLLISKMQ